MSNRLLIGRKEGFESPGAHQYNCQHETGRSRTTRDAAGALDVRILYGPLRGRRTWATLYDIASKEESRGHATELLTAAKSFYEGTGKTFGGTVALNDRMLKIYERLGITEYDGDE